MEAFKDDIQADTDYFGPEDGYAEEQESERSSLTVEFTETVNCTGSGENTPSVKYEAALLIDDDTYDFSAGAIEFDSFEAFKIEVYESLLNDILSMDGCDFNTFSASNR